MSRAERIQTVKTVRIADGVAMLRISNPPLNLISREITAALDKAIEELATQEDTRVLVLTGSGSRAFSAGSDIREFENYIHNKSVVTDKLLYENAVYSRLRNFPKPTIAMLNGSALGGGLELAVCCDFLIAAAECRFGLPEVRIGVMPGSGGTKRVTQRIGEGRAKELMFFGEQINAEQALTWGLVNAVCPASQLLEFTIGKAKTLSYLPNKALQICKQAIRVSQDVAESEAIERSLPLSKAIFETADCAEGARAFLSKRQPNYHHS